MEKTIHFEEQDPNPSHQKDLELVSQKVGTFGNAIQLSWPTDYLVVTQGFGVNPEIHTERGFPSHEGLDIRAPNGSRVFACADGVVETIHAQTDDGNPYGRHLTLTHKDGYRTLYGHLGTVSVTKGQQVRSGTVIGTAGATGQTRGGHIHLSLFHLGTTSNGLTNFPNDIIDPTPFLSFSTKPRDISSYPWPIGRCLSGLHAGKNGLHLDSQTSPLAEAALLPMDVSRDSLTQLRKNNPTLFLMTQLTLPTLRKSISAADWVAWARPSIKQHIDAGVGYFAGLRAPNLTSHGFGLLWESGIEFNGWWQEAFDLLKTDFSSSKFGFPALAPGLQITGQRYDASIFMEEADDAAMNADWIGAICNWNHPKEILDEAKGAYHTRLRRYYPDQLIFITEYGSVNRSSDTTTRASEALRYFEGVKGQSGIGAAFFGG